MFNKIFFLASLFSLILASQLQGQKTTMSESEQDSVGYPKGAAIN